MAWEDRDYNRDRPQFRFTPPGFSGWSVVTWLLIINAAVFLLDTILGRVLGPYGLAVGSSLIAIEPLERWAYFSVDTAFAQFQVWRVFSFQFFHNGLWHLIGNSLGLFFLGPMVEQYLGSRRFLAFYLLCGVAGAAMYTLLWSVGVVVTNPASPLVGASGGVLGILAGAAMIAPDMKILLMFILPIKLKYVCWAVLFIAVAVVIGSGENAGGEAAHLGGAALGFLLILKPGLLNWADGFRAPDIKGAIDQRRRESAAKREAATEAEIDRILAKVSEHGLHSLTAKEKRVLSSETERKNKAG
ncbi:MAG: rhomboid family intramembrane serine protease [Planctomycetota bacterium]